MKRQLGAFNPDTIYQGNALQLMPLISDGLIDLIITDPPFAIDFKAQRENYNRTGSNVLEGYKEIPPAEYREFTQKWIAESCTRACPWMGVCMFFPAGTASGIFSKDWMRQVSPQSTILYGNTNSASLRKKNLLPVIIISCLW